MEQKECKVCLFEEGDSRLFSLNWEGVCNFCEGFQKEWAKRPNEEKRLEKLSGLVQEIKAVKGEYNCLLGLSGGVDSSYLAVWAKENGLRPLIVHFDNGWNSELAVANITSICQKCDFDFKTIVVDWEEFRQMQLAYLEAGVVDIEALTDHAIYATTTRVAQEHGIKYIISGFNLATEGIMPKDWIYDKRDWSNIKDIVRKHGKLKGIKSFPYVSFLKGLKNHFFHKLNIVQPLNEMDYNKEEVKKRLIKEFGWRDYGGKHYESIFTKFYQAYILPVKFGIDKRKAHLATLINSGQMTREKAREELNKELYAPEELSADKEYVLKKFRLSESEFDEIMKGEIRPHSDYKTDKKLWENYFKLVSNIKFWKKRK